MKCENCGVGYANPSFYPDSAVQYATRNARENFARQFFSNYYGEQAFWSTESGTYWLGSTMAEQFDSSQIDLVSNLLIPLDTLISAELISVILGTSGFLSNTFLKKEYFLATMNPPAWIETLPQNLHYIYAVGVAPQFYYEANSWKAAEQMAFRNLAHSIYTSLTVLQKNAAQGQEIRHEIVDAALQNVQTVARWRNMQENVFYVLIRIPKQRQNH